MHRPKLTAQVVVVGASLAGCSVAIELAKKGISVAVVDRANFPRRKACGEGLSQLALPLIQQLGIPMDELLAKAEKLSGYELLVNITNKKNGEKSTKLSCAIGCPESTHAWGISRTNLDTALVSFAKSQSAITLITDQAVRAVDWRDSSYWEIVTNKTRLHCQYLVIATGSNPQGLCSRFVTGEYSNNRRLALSNYGKLREAPALKRVYIIISDNGEIYLTPVGEGTINCSVVGDGELIHRCMNPQNLAQQIFDASGLRIDMMGSAIGSGHINSRNSFSHDYLYLVGDAYESFDPACGLGMTHALASGIRAARSIANSINYPGQTGLINKEYRYQHELSARAIKRYSAVIRGLIRGYYRYPRCLKIFSSMANQRVLKLLEIMAQKGVSIDG